MIFGQNRDELRRMYIDAWRKKRNVELMSALETQIAAVIEEHPEYHDFLEEGESGRGFDLSDGQTNPFLHMGMHLAIREQVSTNRPAGIRDVHNAISRKTGSIHNAEHNMMDCLGETLWEAQRSNSAPDERRYLERLRQLQV